MKLTKDTKLKLNKAFKKTLKGYIEYKDMTDWKNDRGYIDKDNIDNIIFWLIYDIGEV